MEFSKDVLLAMEDLKTAGAASKWGKEATDALRRRNVFMNELRQVRRAAVPPACRRLVTAARTQLQQRQRRQRPPKRLPLPPGAQVGIKNPDQLATPSSRNDAAFLITVVLVSSTAATLAGVLLPGDWGFFSSYLLGGISIAVLAIGSTNPGILQYAIDSFSLIFPDYKWAAAAPGTALPLRCQLGAPVALDRRGPTQRGARNAPHPA
jgi:hypothetical protein